MRKLKLRPYHGRVFVCESVDELREAYEKRTKAAYPYSDKHGGGRYVKLDGETPNDTVWLVWGDSPATLAHEFCHVLLHTFSLIGHNPTEGDGEPFCYMLSQLMLEAAE